MSRRKSNEKKTGGAGRDGLTSRGIRVEFTKEGLSFTGEDSALSKLLPSVMGAFAEFEGSLILERQREGIAIAKAARPKAQP